MVVIFTVTLLVMILLLFSLRACLKVFDKLELILLTLFCSNAVQQTFYTYYSAYKNLQVKESHLEFWISRMDVGIILPALLVWGLYLLRKSDSWLVGVLVVGGFSGLFVGQQKVRIMMGVLIDQNWQPLGTVIRGGIIAAVSVVFMYLLRKQVRKEGLLR